jgi:two-component system, cell cycle response regulator DivK
MKGTRILLVDDFEDARDMYMTYLQYEGYEVLTASTALEALALASNRRPDLILMDAGLPGMTGWEAIAELKGNDATRDIPVLMLTGHVLKESQDRAAAAGADGFIPKPCLPDELSREIRHALRGRGARQGETDAQRLDRTRSASADTTARLKRARARRERS